MNEDITSFPLYWPNNQQRTESHKRQRASILFLRQQYT